MALLPGGKAFTTAASKPPLPELVKGMTELRVWKTYCKSSSTSARTALFSTPVLTNSRWAARLSRG